MQTTRMDILHQKPFATSLRVRVWIRISRDSKSFCFIEINDGYQLHNSYADVCATLEHDLNVIIP
jgi:aspartyl/asparaginyl-tRNA synthetase